MAYLFAAFGVLDLVGFDVEHKAAHLHRQLDALWRRFKALDLFTCAVNESTSCAFFLEGRHQYKKKVTIALAGVEVTPFVEVSYCRISPRTRQKKQ